MSQSLLLIYVHPATHASRVNRTLLEAARGVSGVDIHDLYACYPDFFIETKAEQALLMHYDRIVVQHPFYWYSVPALFKEWLDSVLAYGWAYGPGGEALVGKYWTHAISTGGQDTAYSTSGSNRFTMEELLRPLEASAWRCGMRWQAPFVVHAARSLSDQTLSTAAEQYQDWLKGLLTLPPTGHPQESHR